MSRWDQDTVAGVRSESQATELMSGLNSSWA
jgi:hypothetical protein